jgi:hypothetical protein
LFVYYFLYDNYTKNSMLTTFYIIYLWKKLSEINIC